MNKVKIKLKAGEKRNWFNIIVLFILYFSLLLSVYSTYTIRGNLNHFIVDIGNYRSPYSVYEVMDITIILLLVILLYKLRCEIGLSRIKNIKTNCSYCDKELKVRYPKENIECPKCKTLHVIDWDKDE